MSRSLPVTGNTEHTRPENRVFYPALDGLRAIAFLMVFSYHYRDTPWGWAGVDVFFVLSGFLITGILYDSRDDAHRARNFYVRRTLRIFPLYYGIFLALLLLYPFEHWRWSWAWLIWPAYIGNIGAFLHRSPVGSPWWFVANAQLMARNPGPFSPLSFAHFWSLCVEEQFYLLWPWVVFRIADRRKLMWICAGSLPVCVALRFLAEHRLPAWMVDRSVITWVTPFRIDSLLLGGLLALLLRGPAAASLLRWTRLVSPWIFAPLVLYASFVSLFHAREFHYVYPVNIQGWGFTFADLITALLLLNIIQPGALLCRALSLRPLRWLGRISYSAYVFHEIFHNFYARLDLRLIAWTSAHHPIPIHVLNQASWLMPLAGTLLLAWLSFRFFESPFLNLKERWTIRGAA